MSEADVDHLVRQNEIPFVKQGPRVVFRLKEIEAWASQRILGWSAARLERYHKTATNRRQASSQPAAVVSQLLQPGYIASALTSKTRASVMRTMVTLAEESGLVAAPDDLLSRVEERERICATALEGGVALLHPIVHDPHLFLESMIFLGRTIQAIPFGAPDGSVTDLFFLVCCRDSRLHLHVLARLCMMSLQTDLLASLRAAPDAAAMHNEIRRCEQLALKMA